MDPATLETLLLQFQGNFFRLFILVIFPLYFCSLFLKLGRVRRWRVTGDTVLDRVASRSLSDEVTSEQKLE